MKIVYSIAAIGCVLISGGCVSTSKVQEMIDASHQDYTTQANEQADSIDVLKQTSMTSLEKVKANGEAVVAIQSQLEKMSTDLETIRGFADASKVMSAANTVKLADLDAAIQENDELVQDILTDMKTIDELFERVMLHHYEKIITSATEAKEMLIAEGLTSNTNAPIDLDAPIEIVAPDTSITSTNEVAATNETAIVAPAE